MEGIYVISLGGFVLIGRRGKRDSRENSGQGFHGGLAGKKIPERLFSGMRGFLHRYLGGNSSARVGRAFYRYFRGVQATPEIGLDSGDECSGRKLVHSCGDDQAERHIPIKAYYFCTRY